MAWPKTVAHILVTAAVRGELRVLRRKTVQGQRKFNPCMTVIAVNKPPTAWPIAPRNRIFIEGA